MLANHESVFDMFPLFQATKRKVQARIGGMVPVEGVFCYVDQVREDCLRFAFKSGTKTKHLEYAVKVIYSMVRKINDRFFSKSRHLSHLGLSLLIPSSSKTGNILCEYSNLLKRIDEKATTVIADPLNGSTELDITSYSHWISSVA